jgi:site-specific DNA-cytosine methylase
LKHTSIIPLIGGLEIATIQELDTLPEFVLSYPSFKYNDGIFLKNYPSLKDKYFVISEDGEFINLEDKIKFEKLNKNIDIVNSLCPCSGLSLLNSNSKSGDKARGSDAIQNRFMYFTTNFVLNNIKPKVFVFENAPNLFTNAGKGVFNNLVELSNKYGYSFSLFKTTTSLHGIPQNRQRTFGFFWKSNTAPILNWIRKPHKTLCEYFKEIPDNCTLHDKEKIIKDYEENDLLNFIKSKGITLEEISKKFKTIHWYILNDIKLLDECIEYMKNVGNKSQINTLTHAKKKIEMNKRYWDSSPVICKDTMNAVISKNMFRTILVDEHRFLTIREYMHLMGLPFDFEINEKEVCAITQNVPVNTAKDMINQCVKFINGELQLSSVKVLKQNNMNRTIEIFKQEYKSNFMELI